MHLGAGRQSQNKALAHSALLQVISNTFARMEAFDERTHDEAAAELSALAARGAPGGGGAAAAGASEGWRDGVPRGDSATSGRMFRDPASRVHGAGFI